MPTFACQCDAGNVGWAHMTCPHSAIDQIVDLDGEVGWAHGACPLCIADQIVEPALKEPNPQDLQPENVARTTNGNAPVQTIEAYSVDTGNPR
jgi:hypothetical protein